VKGRRETERGLRIENRRLMAALSAIHNHLHADAVDAAHEACECALEGKTVAQPNLSVADSAGMMTLAAEFNAMIARHGTRSVCITLVPSATVRGAVSLQICGEVQTCKVIEARLRGSASTYMGDHGGA
jgi:precorrin-3B methylase